MAKKTRRQKQRAVTRRPGVPAAFPVGGAPTGLAPAGVASVPAPGPSPAAAAAKDAAATTPFSGGPSLEVEPARRRVERVSPLAAGVRVKPAGRGQAAGYIQPLESEDAAIPFDRVPYVPADLRRVAVIAVIMVALIIIADIIVSNVVK